MGGMALPFFGFVKGLVTRVRARLIVLRVDSGKLGYE
jgi:hypothetical protein